MDLKKLKDKFPEEDIEWRVSRSGMKGDGKIWALVLAYVTNRAIMDRLDEAVGPENWQNEFLPGPNGGVMCGLSIRMLKEDWVKKWDGADNTNFEAVKGGFSDAMKRAGYQWGIGRYLYKLPETFAVISEKGRYSDKVKSSDGKVKWFKWNPPDLPKWALPAPKEQTGKPKQQKKDAKTTKNFKFLESVKKLKANVREEDYYQGLGLYGVEHANEILDRKTQEDFYKLLKGMPVRQVEDT